MFLVLISVSIQNGGTTPRSEADPCRFSPSVYSLGRSDQWLECLFISDSLCTISRDCDIEYAFKLQMKLLQRGMGYMEEGGQNI